MKGISNSFLRTICALIIGLVLVMFPNEAGDYLVITIGVVFLIPSLLKYHRVFCHDCGGEAVAFLSKGSAACCLVCG